MNTPMTSVPPRFHTSRDVMRGLGISRCTLYRWLQSGAIDATITGNGWIFSDAQYQAAARYQAELHRVHPASEEGRRLRIARMLADQQAIGSKHPASRH